MDLDGVGGGLGRVSSLLVVFAGQMAKRHHRPSRGRQRPQRPKQDGPGREELRPTRSFTRPVKVESLRVYEGDGRGHTLGRHVNNAPNADVERLQREHDIPASGSFRDEATAQRAFEAAVAANSDAILNWLNNPQARGPYVHDHNMGEVIGSVLTRTAYNKARARGETPTPVDASVIRIVLRRSDSFSGGFFLLTAYPVPTTAAADVTPLHVAPLRMYEGDGHTLARHVEISAGSLVSRLEAEPDITAASRFADEVTAQRAVERAIAAKTAEIHDWLATGKRFPFTGAVTLDETVGVVLTRQALDSGRTQPAPANRVHFVLIRSDRYPDGFFVKTAYPLLPW